MMYLGDFAASGKVAVLWNTHAIAGESITRATDGTLKIFKAHATAATWATERSSLAGVTQLEDFDATGIHSVYIDLSDNTDAGFYAAGNEYQVAIVGAVVDGKTVNVPLAHFSIERAGGVAAILARLPAALVSGRMDASVGVMASGVLTATAIAADAITAAKLDPDVTTELQAGLATAAAIDALPTAAENADAVWDELAADHVGAGSMGEVLGVNIPNDLNNINNALGDIPNDAATAVWQFDIEEPAAAGSVAELLTDAAAGAALIPGTQDGFTFAEYVKLTGAVLLGEASGLDTTTAVYRSMDDTANRVTATVDTDGNRSAVTLNTA